MTKGLLFVAAFAASVSSARACEMELRSVGGVVGICVEQVSDNVVDFTVRNRSEEMLRIYTGEMPWNAPNSMVIAVVNARTGTALPRAPLLNDVGPLSTVLEAGQSVSGALDLRFLIPGGLKPSGSDEAILFWYWKIGSVDGGTIDEVGGWLRLRNLPD